MHNHSFRMLDQEARLTQSALLSGLEFLTKLNYDRKETVYPALFQLSIGLERLFKIVIVVDHKVRNDLESPDNKIVRGFSHNLIQAHAACHRIMQREVADFAWPMPGSIELELIQCLSEFARGSRYYNLDQLTGEEGRVDPLAMWFNLHIRVAESEISHAQREAINERAIAHCDRYGLFGWEQDWKGEFMPTVDMVFIHELFRRSRPACTWVVMKILYPFHDLLRALSVKAHELEDLKGRRDMTVPFLYEYFPFFLTEKRTCMRRKRWIEQY